MTHYLLLPAYIVFEPCVDSFLIFYADQVLTVFYADAFMLLFILFFIFILNELYLEWGKGHTEGKAYRRSPLTLLQQNIMWDTAG